MDKIIEEEFESKQRMPVQMKKATLKEILKNLIMVVVVLVVLSIICFMDEKLVQDNYAFGLKIISTVLAIFSVILFEIAYRKDNTDTAIWAIEAFVLGMIVMFVPYLSRYTKMFIFGIAIFFGGYYLIKLLLIVLKKRKEFNSTKSDVKDIIKDEKSSYLDDVSKKKFDKGGKK